MNCTSCRIYGRTSPEIMNQKHAVNFYAHILLLHIARLSLGQTSMEFTLSLMKLEYCSCDVHAPEDVSLFGRLNNVEIYLVCIMYNKTFFGLRHI